MSACKPHVEQEECSISSSVTVKFKAVPPATMRTCDEMVPGKSRGSMRSSTGGAPRSMVKTVSISEMLGGSARHGGIGNRENRIDVQSRPEAFIFSIVAI